MLQETVPFTENLRDQGVETVDVEIRHFSDAYGTLTNQVINSLLIKENQKNELKKILLRNKITEEGLDRLEINQLSIRRQLQSLPSIALFQWVSDQPLQGRNLQEEGFQLSDERAHELFVQLILGYLGANTIAPVTDKTRSELYNNAKASIKSLLETNGLSTPNIRKILEQVAKIQKGQTVTDTTLLAHLENTPVEVLNTVRSIALNSRLQAEKAEFTQTIAEIVVEKGGTERDATQVQMLLRDAFQGRRTLTFEALRKELTSIEDPVPALALIKRLYHQIQMESIEDSAIESASAVLRMKNTDRNRVVTFQKEARALLHDSLPPAPTQGVVDEEVLSIMVQAHDNMMRIILQNDVIFQAEKLPISPVQIDTIAQAAIDFVYSGANSNTFDLLENRKEDLLTNLKSRRDRMINLPVVQLCTFG